MGRFRVDCSDHGWPRVSMTGDGGKRWSASFGPEDIFGASGPFGRHGPFGPDGPFGPGGPFGRGYRGNRRRSRMFGAGELRLLLLWLIAQEPRHGYELIKAVEEMTGGSYSPSPGAVYPTLSLLEDEGALAEAAGDEPRKAYQATEAGCAELAERAEEAERLVERLSEHGERRRPYATPEMFRAVGNLATVLKNRARSGTLDEATIEQIVDMIDEMAKRIERL